jgi:hypothetical protein
VQSREILNTIATARTFKVRPSELLAIDEEYTAYCFDEACAYIIAQMEDKKTPHFKEDEKENKGLQILLK